MRIEFEADELDVGMRKSDSSPWIKFHLGEYNKEVAGELYKISGMNVVYKIILEVKEKN